MMKNGVITKTLAYYKGPVPEFDMDYFEKMIGNPVGENPHVSGLLHLDFSNGCFTVYVKYQFNCSSCGVITNNPTIMGKRNLLAPYMAYEDDTQDVLYALECPKCSHKHVIHYYNYPRTNPDYKNRIQVYCDSKGISKGELLIDSIYSIKKGTHSDILFIAQQTDGMAMVFSEKTNDQREVISREKASVMDFILQK